MGEGPNPQLTEKWLQAFTGEFDVEVIFRLLLAGRGIRRLELGTLRSEIGLAACVNLRFLDLSHNELGRMETANVFERLVFLEHLDLSHNKISKIDAVPSRLKVLRLLGNPISRLTDLDGLAVAAPGPGVKSSSSKQDYSFVPFPQQPPAHPGEPLSSVQDGAFKNTSSEDEVAKISLALEHLSLQQIDGSDACPVCLNSAYREYVLRTLRLGGGILLASGSSSSSKPVAARLRSLDSERLAALWGSGDFGAGPYGSAFQKLRDAALDAECVGKKSNPDSGGGYYTNNASSSNSSGVLLDPETGALGNFQSGWLAEAASLEPLVVSSAEGVNNFSGEDVESSPPGEQQLGDLRRERLSLEAALMRGLQETKETIRAVYQISSDLSDTNAVVVDDASETVI